LDGANAATRHDAAALPKATRRQVALGAAALGQAAALPPSGRGARAEVATPAASPAPGGDPVVLGCPYNLSGAYASIGTPARDGSLLAATEINRVGGVLGRPFRLQVADVTGDPAEAAVATRRLIDDDRVAAVVGLTDTTFALAAAPVAQATGVPFLDVGATAPAIAAVGDFVFMLPFGDNGQAAVAAEYGAAAGFRRVAILRNRDTEFTRLLAGSFAARFVAPDLGGVIVGDEGYAADGADVPAALDALAALDPAPDALVSPPDRRRAARWSSRPATAVSASRSSAATATTPHGWPATAAPPPRASSSPPTPGSTATRRRSPPPS